jgi:aminoglycoside phosphotransferase (APT) family kinase protein
MHYVVKGLFTEGLEHDYPADRAGVFLLDLDEFGHLPNHVKAVDVLAELEDGSIKSIGGGKEYYLLMERAEGRHYFNDLSAMSQKNTLDKNDIAKIETMTSYLADIHSVKKDSRQLYWRKVRDTIGHGECLMGVFDTYPEGTVRAEEITAIEKKCVDWRARLKPKFKRLCQVHGDFHPGNIWFQDNKKLVLLDRSRGPWGDAADDITALTMNYIFFSLNTFGTVQGIFYDALKLFYDEYVTITGDSEVFEVAAPFYAFRGAVVANPVFYPDVTQETRRRLFNFINGVLDDDSFKIERINRYIEEGSEDSRSQGF